MTTLANLRKKPDYYRADSPEWVRSFWPRIESFNWFLRAHRDSLVETGAIRRLGRDYFIDCELFPPAAHRILGVELDAAN